MNPPAAVPWIISSSRMFMKPAMASTIGSEFMASRLGNPAFGGWLNHGSDLGAVAKVVSKHYAKLHKADAAAATLEKFVLDTMAGGTPEIPLVDGALQEAVNAACGAIKTDWYPNVTEDAAPWWSQAKSDKITMDDGRVYQQAYATTWVSYPASERRKASPAISSARQGSGLPSCSRPITTRS